MSADTPLSQKVQDLDRQIAAKIETLVKGVHSQIGDRVRAATDDVVKWIEEHAPEIPTSFLSEDDLTAPAAPAPESSGAAGDDYGLLLSAVSRLDTETGQAEILGGLLEESLRFSSRAAFFLIRQGQVRGWAAKGFGSGDETIGGVEEKADQDPWAEIQERGSSLICSDEQLAGMAIRINTSPAAQAVLLPFAIRGQIAGVLYADADAGAALSVSALQLLVHAAASALETSNVSPGLSPCLKLSGESASGAAEVSTPVSHEDQAAPAAEPVALAAVGEAATEDLVAATEEPAVEEPEPVVEEPEPVVDAASVDTSVSPMAVPAVVPIDTVNTEDLETTVVPAMGDEADGALEAPPVSEPEMISEPTVEFDAPALALGGPAEPVESEAPQPPTFESVDVSPPSEEEIALEAEPEPELEMEDTNAWGADEEEEEDEPTQVGMAAKLDPPEPPALEISESPAASIPSPQDTVRLPAMSPQSEAPPVAPTAPAFDAPVAPEPPAAPTFEAPPVAPVAPEPPAAPTFVAPEPVAPEPPAAPTFVAPEPIAPEPPAAPTAPSFADPVPPVAPAAPASFADPAPAPVAPAAPASFADPAPAPVAPAAPTSFADPAPPPAAPPTSQVKPPSSSEVKPPSDLEGPGLAFATASNAPGEDSASSSLHEEARRLARLLVSEIKLYNEEIIEEGRRTGNIYERLKDDIDRSRQMYEERIDPRLADQEDYFHQELVQRLAGGDPNLLGV